MASCTSSSNSGQAPRPNIQRSSRAHSRELRQHQSQSQTLAPTSPGEPSRPTTPALPAGRHYPASSPTNSSQDDMTEHPQTPSLQHHAASQLHHEATASRDPTHAPTEPPATQEVPRHLLPPMSPRHPPWLTPNEFLEREPSWTTRDSNNEFIAETSMTPESRIQHIVRRTRPCYPEIGSYFDSESYIGH